MPNKPITILSEILKKALLDKIFQDKINIEDISKATGIKTRRIIDIINGRSGNVKIGEFSALLEFCNLEITNIFIFKNLMSILSFEFTIDEDFFSLN